MIDSDSKNERPSWRRCPNSNLSIVEVLVQTKAMDKAIHKMDIELRRGDSERRARMFEQSERDAAKRYE